MLDPVILPALARALEAVGVDDAATRLADSPDVTFDELGVDSLAVIEIVARLAAEGVVDIPDEELTHLHGPGDIVAYRGRAAAPAA